MEAWVIIAPITAAILVGILTGSPIVAAATIFAVVALEALVLRVVAWTAHRLT